jgi:hypothetical protein
LRRDFVFLANIYVSGHYGEFKYEHSFSETKDLKESRRLSVLKFFWKFLGITFPLLLMGLYLSGYIFHNAEKYRDAVTYIFFAWFLISYDITLKLGIIESLVKFAQGLRELGK